MRRKSAVRRPVERFALGDDGAVERRRRRDVLAAEEPLEIRVAPAGRPPVRLSVTMRTPGHDFELAAGLLYGEGLIDRPEAIASIRYCVDAALDEVQQYNVVRVDLAPGVELDPAALQRSGYTTSSCGVCGKASIEAALAPSRGCPAPAPLRVAPETLLGMPAQLRTGQALFQRTGGLHAAALFDAEGRMLRLREDVGRHNALDKLMGASLLAGELPLRGGIVLLSSRLGYELVQKAARAGASVLAGVSAPSSLAVELAERAGLTLVGFLRERSFNVYAGAARVTEPVSRPTRPRPPSTSTA